MRLRPYQEEIAKRAEYSLLTHGLAYLSMECRTGKTLTALEALRRCEAKSVLFITKKKAMESVRRDYEALQSATVIFAIDIINHESAHKAKGNWDYVVIDEAHCLGAFPKPSKKTQSIRNLCKGCRVLFLSGTPSPESYSQLYHQLWVCEHSPWSHYTNFYKWAKDYVNVIKRTINGYSVNDYSQAYEGKIKADVEDIFISFTQKEAGFETKIEENVFTVKMSQETRQLLRTIYRNRVVYWDSHPILAETPAKLMTKMHQISSGTVIDEEGDHHIIDSSKASFIRDVFPGYKIAIFYVYQSEFDLLRRFFPNWTDSPEEFQASSDKTFLCQVRRAREGIRLDSADALIFYNLEYSYLSYEQGRNRLVSKERETPADVYFLCSDCGIEQDILKAVRGKNDFTLSWYHKNKSYGTM